MTKTNKKNIFQNQNKTRNETESTDRKLTARFFTLVMAFQRFANLTEDDIDAFQENAIDKNTKSSTKYWIG